MSEISGFWTTDGVSPEGHQVAGYTEAHWSIAGRIMAGAAGYEGVVYGIDDELECEVSAANTVDVKSGCALVDGKWYQNDAVEQVNIPSASAGNTRIDRIVLRCDWASYTVEIYRIAGTDSGSPTAPAITQTPGTTYDIMLCQALVDPAGVVVVTDERVYAEVQDGTIENSKLTDPYDVIIMRPLEADESLLVEDGIDGFNVPDVWDGKSVVKLWAKLSTASSSGGVTVRLYNEDEAHVIATLTIPEGQYIASTSVIGNPVLSENDYVRVDITGAGTDTLGLDVQIKVDKS